MPCCNANRPSLKLASRPVCMLILAWRRGGRREGGGGGGEEEGRRGGGGEGGTIPTE